MKQKLNTLLIITILIITITAIFNSSSKINIAVLQSFEMFANNIFPSLFPMFIISSILVNIGIPELLGKFFSKPMSFLFKTKSSASFVFFMSMITGFPSSAKYIEDLLEKKLISKNHADKILLFTFFSNPLFIVNTVGIMFLKNKELGYLMLISHIIGNILIGIIFRNYNQEKDNENTSIKESLKTFHHNIQKKSIFQILLNSIQNSIETLVIIFGIITTFMIIINIFFPSNNSLISILGASILEMTSGLKYISTSDLSITLKINLSMFFISFGGLSIHTQIMNILKEKKVRYLPFLFARIIHGALSVIILNFILYFIT